jgi:hypothetical protein
MAGLLSGPFYTDESFCACTAASVNIFDQSGGSAGLVYTWHREHVHERVGRGVYGQTSWRACFL